MESRIDELLEKYWKGSTTLEEERIIKAHFASNPSIEENGKYFRFLNQEKKVKMDVRPQRRKNTSWLSAAAVTLVGIVTAYLVVQFDSDPYAIEDPREAFEQTKKVLMLVGTELNDGQSHTLELTKIDEVKENLEIRNN